jgi:hypothetical protein
MSLASELSQQTMATIHWRYSEPMRSLPAGTSG